MDDVELSCPECEVLYGPIHDREKWGYCPACWNKLRAQVAALTHQRDIAVKALERIVGYCTGSPQTYSSDALIMATKANKGLDAVRRTDV